MARPPCPGTAGSRRRAGHRSVADGRAPRGCAARSRWRRARARGLRPARRASRTVRSAARVPQIAAAVSSELRDAEAEDVASHREQARELELEPDEEQQHHDPELGDGQDALGRVEDASGHRGRSPRPPPDRRRSRESRAKRAIGTLTTAAASSTRGSPMRPIWAEWESIGRSGGWAVFSVAAGAHCAEIPNGYGCANGLVMRGGDVVRPTTKITRGGCRP